MREKDFSSPQLTNNAFVSSKNFPSLFLFSLILIIISVITTYYVLQFRQAKQIQNQLTTLRTQSFPSPTSGIDEMINWKTYTNLGYGYTVEYPSSWDLEEAIDTTQRSPLTPTWEGSILNDNLREKVSFLEKEEKAWKGMFRIEVLKNPQKLTLDQWTKNYHIPLTADPQTNLAKIVGDTTLGNLPAKRLSIFAFDHEDTAIVTVKDNFVYYLAFTGDNPNDPDKTYHDYIYNQILSTFKFLDQSPEATDSSCVSKREQSLGGDPLLIKSSSRLGFCELMFPLKNSELTGYSLVYPESWTVRLAGAAGLNLAFNEENYFIPIFLQLTSSNLPLELADKITYIPFEQSEPESFVDPSEAIISKKLMTVGNKKTLILTTKKESDSFKRYFIAYNKGGKNTIYMFLVKFDTANIDSPEYKQLISNVEEMIASLKFID